MKITVYNRKQRYTYFEKIIILCLFIRWNKDILLMFQPCLDFYEIWNNKIQQLNDKICYRKEEKKNKNKNLMTKENFLKFYWEFYEERKQIEWYENYILWQSIHPTKLRSQIWEKKNLNNLVASIRTTTSSFLLAFTLCKNSRIKHGV